MYFTHHSDFRERWLIIFISALASIFRASAHLPQVLSHPHVSHLPSFLSTRHLSLGFSSLHIGSVEAGI